MRGRRRSTAAVRKGRRRRWCARNWPSVSTRNRRKGTVASPGSVPALPGTAEIDADGEQGEARKHRAGPAVVLVGESEAARLAVGGMEDSEHAEHDPSDADQGQEGEQIPHRILIEGGEEGLDWHG